MSVLVSGRGVDCILGLGSGGGPLGRQSTTGGDGVGGRKGVLATVVAISTLWWSFLVICCSV